MKALIIKICVLSAALMLNSGYSAVHSSENGLHYHTGKQGNYRVLRGERPPVVLDELPDSAWHQGILRIKIKPDLAKSLPSYLVVKSGESYVITGNAAIDSLNRLLQAREYKNILHGYYSTAVKAAEYAGRHSAWGFDMWYDVRLDEKTDIRQAVKLFLAIDEILMAEPVYRVEHIYRQGSSDISKSGNSEGTLNDKSTWTPNDPLFPGHWSYHNTGQHGGTPGSDIDLVRAWAIEKGHPEVIVAVLDGGVEHWHPDLEANMWEGIGYNFSADTTVIFPDPQGHGTHVAGTVAAVSNNHVGVAGVAGGSGSGDGARIMTCQVFNPDYSASGFEQAFIFAADNGAAIAQNSWIYSVPGTYNQAVLDAIDYFNANGGGEVMQGGITLFATGNNNSGAQFYPAFYSGTFSVAGTTNKDLKAGYSNFGQYVDISAPGGFTSVIPEQGILSTTVNGQYQFKQGTSMACPHASGAAALLVSYAHRNQIGITPQEVKELLVHNTDNIYFADNLNHLNMLGSGRLNAFKALLDLQNKTLGLPNPGNFAANPTGTHEIQINWQSQHSHGYAALFVSYEPTHNQPENGVAYTVGETVEGIGTLLYKGTANSFMHSDLSAGTLYHYRIFAYDETENYSTGLHKPAFTPCEAFNLPLEENFSHGFVPPLCWSTIDLDGDGNTWKRFFDYQDFEYVAASFSHSGNAPLTPDNWLITPAINVTSGNIILEFYVKAGDIFNWNEKYSVMVSDQGNDNPESFVGILTATPASNQWEKVSVNLPGYMGKEIHVAFRHWDTHGIDRLLLKDISLLPGKPGDVNPDNDINILDVVWLVRHLNGDTPEGFIYDAADLNEDGVVDQQDLEILIQMVMEFTGSSQQ